jgi:hypothetical protein
MQVQTGTLTREGKTKTMERERKKQESGGEKQREVGGKDAGRGRGNARGGGEKVSRKGERRRGRLATTTATHDENEGTRGGGTGQEGGGPVHCAKIGRGECTRYQVIL